MGYGSIDDIRKSWGSPWADASDEQVLDAYSKAAKLPMAHVADKLGYGDPEAGLSSQRLRGAFNNYGSGLLDVGEHLATMAGADGVAGSLRSGRTNTKIAADVAQARAKELGGIDSYREIGNNNGFVSDSLNYAGGLFAQSLPYLLEGATGGVVARGLSTGLKATSAAGRASGATAGAVAAAKKADSALVARGMAGGVVATYPSSLGDVLGNQREASPDGSTNFGSAALGAVPYSLLNGTLGAGRLVAQGSLARSGVRALDGMTGFTGGAARTAATMGRVGVEQGASEAGQEFVNQFFGRMAVNPEASMTDPDAIERYKESFVGGATLGGLFGIPGGHRRSAGYRPSGIVEEGKPADLLQLGLDTGIRGNTLYGAPMVTFPDGSTMPQSEYRDVYGDKNQRSAAGPSSVVDSARQSALEKAIQSGEVSLEDAVSMGYVVPPPATRGMEDLAGNTDPRLGSTGPTVLAGHPNAPASYADLIGSQTRGVEVSPYEAGALAHGSLPSMVGAGGEHTDLQGFPYQILNRDTPDQMIVSGGQNVVADPKRYGDFLAGPGTGIGEGIEAMRQRMAQEQEARAAGQQAAAAFGERVRKSGLNPAEKGHSQFFGQAEAAMQRGVVSSVEFAHMVGQIQGGVDPKTLYDQVVKPKIKAADDAVKAAEKDKAKLQKLRDTQSANLRTVVAEEAHGLVPAGATETIKRAIAEGQDGAAALKAERNNQQIKQAEAKQAAKEKADGAKNVPVTKPVEGGSKPAPVTNGSVAAPRPATVSGKPNSGTTTGVRPADRKVDDKPAAAPPPVVAPVATKPVPATTTTTAPAADPKEQATRTKWNDAKVLSDAPELAKLPVYDDLHPDAKSILAEGTVNIERMAKAGAAHLMGAAEDARIAEQKKHNIDVADVVSKVAKEKAVNMRKAMLLYMGLDEAGDTVGNPMSMADAAKTAGYSDHTALSRKLKSYGITEEGVNRLHAGDNARHMDNEAVLGGEKQNVGDVNANVAALKPGDIRTAKWYTSILGDKTLAELDNFEFAHLMTKAIEFENNQVNNEAIAALGREFGFRDKKAMAEAIRTQQKVMADRAKEKGKKDGQVDGPVAADGYTEDEADTGAAGQILDEDQGTGPANPDNAQFSKTKTEGVSDSQVDERYTVDELTSELNAFMQTDSLGRNVKVIGDVSELKDVRDMIAYHLGDVMAWTRDGKAYLIANKIKKGEGRAVFLHEVGAHLGMERLLTKEMHTQLAEKVREWAATKDGSIESKIAKRAIDRAKSAGTDKAGLNNEHIAYFIEEAMKAGLDPAAASPEVRNWFRRIWAAFKVAVGKLAMNPDKLTAQDVLNLAHGAARLEMSGKWHGADSSRVQFSKADTSEASAAEAMFKEVSDHINSMMSPKAKDSWATVTDFFKKISPAMLSNAQLVEQYGGKLESLGVYRAKQEKMTQDRLTQSMAFHNVAVEWDKAPTDLKDRVGKVMLDATMGQMHPDLDFTHKDNNHLTPEALAKHQALKARYSALGPQGHKIYHAAKNALDKQWDDRKKAYEELVSYVYQQRIQKALDRNDMDSVAKLTLDRDVAVKEYDKQLAKIKGPYFPLMRFGDFLAIGESKELLDIKAKMTEATGDKRRALESKFESMKKDPKHYEVSGHETRGKLNAAHRAMKAKGLTPRATMTDQRIEGAGFKSQEILSNIGNVIEASFDQDIAGKLNESISDIYLRTLPEMHALRQEAHRKGIEGANPDMLRAFSATGQQSAFYISRLKYAKDLTDTMFKMKREAADDLDLQHIHREMEKRAALDMQYKETPIQDAISSVSWVYHLGMSPSNMLINATQPWTVAVPLMAGRHHLAPALRHLGAAYGDAQRILREARYKDGKFDPWSGITENSLTNRMERLAIRNLMERGLVDEGMQHELNMFADDKSRWLAKFNRHIGWANQQIELANRLSTALASFRLEMKKSNGNYEQSLKYAYDTTLNSQFDYSAENKARVMREGGGVPLAKLVFQFRNFQQGMLYTLGSNITKSFGSGTEAKEARASLRYLTLASGLTAGAMGLPFASTYFLLSNLFRDDDDPEGDAKTAFRNALLGVTGDKDIADVLAKGLPAAFGIDISNRIGLGDVASLFPMANFDGRTGADQEGKLLSAALGPATGLAARLYDGIAAVSNGDLLKGVEKITPKVLADFAKATRYATDGMTDGGGNPTGTNLSPTNILSRAFGFAPIKESNYYEGTKAVKNTEAAVNARIGSIAAKYKEGVRTGDLSEARKLIDAFNKDHPKTRITWDTERGWRNDAKQSASGRGESGVKQGTGKKAAYNHLAAFAG